MENNRKWNPLRAHKTKEDSCCLNTIVVSNSMLMTNNSCVAVVSGRNKEMTVSLRCKSSPQLSGTECCMPLWAFDYLAIGVGCTVYVRAVEPEERNCEKVELTLVGHYKYGSVSNAAEFFTPCDFLITGWPHGIGMKSFQKMIPSLFCGYCVYDGSVVAVGCFDCMVLFRCKLFMAGGGDGGEENYSLHLHTLELLRLVEIVEAGQPTAVESGLESSLYPDFSRLPRYLQPAIELAWSVICGGSNATSQEHRRDYFPGSILFSAPRGGGKSTLLANLHQNLYGQKGLRAIQLSLRKEFSTLDTTTGNVPVVKSGFDKLCQLCRLYSETMSDVSDSMRGMKVVVVLLDDVDALLDYNGMNETENGFSISSGITAEDRLRLAQFLLRELLCELRSNNSQNPQVFVVGTTSLPPNLLKPHHEGVPEFELVRVLQRPHLDDRIEMIQKELMEWSTSAQLEGFSSQELGSSLSMWSRRLAGLTAGYLPGDIADMLRYLKRSEHYGPAQNESTEQRRTICWKQALAAVAAVPPRQLRDLQQSRIGGDTSSIIWSDFAGYAVEKSTVQRILSFQSGVRDLKSWSRYPLKSKGIVLHGPSGCGKTFLASVIAAEARMSFISIRSTDILSKYFGQTEASIRDLFQKARAASPCALFFDDFDAIARKRSEGDESTCNDLNGRILSTFLNELDGVVGNNENCCDGRDPGSLLVIVACCDIAVLDPALIRPGRLQWHVQLGYPTEPDLVEILRVSSRRHPLGEDVDCARIINHLWSKRCNASVRLTGADITGLCRRALLCALRESIRQRNSIERPSGGSDEVAALHAVCAKHFAEAIYELGFDTGELDSEQQLPFSVDNIKVYV